jgi:16S rRNA (cytosine1402-N4)-methyltransferase
MLAVAIPYAQTRARVRSGSPMKHIPVMTREVLHHLLHENSRRVLDGTVGFGGHAEAILQASSSVHVVGVDRDPMAIEAAARRPAPFRDRVTLVQGAYADLANALGSGGPVDGVLLDLGVSSPQIDNAARGFAHGAPGPLDMRMASTGETAAELLRRSSLEEIARLLRTYGDVRQPRRVARAIHAAAERNELNTTADLKNAVAAAKGGYAPVAELSRVFQAVRIAVNGELEQLQRFLAGVLDVIRPGGRLVILSYHSLEDRMVKEFMRDAARDCVCPPGVPVCVCGRVPTLKVLTRRAVHADAAETRANPRARSAVLRAAERLVPGGKA